jgi:DNA-binding LytR/AlgR family response regulator
MNCLVVDDEPLARELLEGYISEMPDLRLISTCSNALEAIAVLEKETVDVLFLDINMPRLSGLEMLRTLSVKPAVVLTTAYPEYAVEGFNLDVADYLLKPFSFERFLKAVNKVKALTGKSDSTGAHEVLAIKADKRTWQVELRHITYIESSGDYVIVHTNERKITAHDTLRNLESRLPEGRFLRVHKSYIVATPVIEFAEGNMLHIAGTNIPIGKTYREKVQNRLGL